MQPQEPLFSPHCLSHGSSHPLSASTHYPLPRPDDLSSQSDSLRVTNSIPVDPRQILDQAYTDLKPPTVAEGEAEGSTAVFGATGTGDGSVVMFRHCLTEYDGLT